MTTQARQDLHREQIVADQLLYQVISDYLAALEAKERSVKFWFRLSLIILSVVLISTAIFFPGIKALIITILVFLAGFLIYLVWMSFIREDKRDRERELRLLAEALGYI